MNNKNKLLVITHNSHRWMGMVATLAAELGLAVENRSHALGDPLPDDLSRYRGVVVLGGTMGVYDHPELDWLARELTWLEKAARQEVPLLGICLGCQMLSHVFGGTVSQGEHGRELGFMKLSVCADDPVFGREMDGRDVLQWHGDTFTLPQSATRLASGPVYANQAARFSPGVYGLQFHPEATPCRISLWINMDREMGVPIPENFPPVEEVLARGKTAFPHKQAWLKAFMRRLLAET